MSVKDLSEYLAAEGGIFCLKGVGYEFKCEMTP